jgi:ketosteroid isomerase-like protein
MSQQNVELVRRRYEAFARGDIESALAMFHPDIQIEDHDRSLETPTTYEGRDGFLILFATVNEGFSDVRYIPEDVTEVDDQVLVQVRRTGRGEVSGAQVDERQFHIWDVVAGRAVRFRVYLDHDQALEAVGLRE